MELFFFRFHKRSLWRKNFYNINLQNIGERKIKLTLLDTNNLVLKSRMLRGKIKDGYFITNGKVIFLPFIIVNAFGTEKTRIGVLENSHLLIDRKKVSFGNIFIYPAGGTTNEHKNNYIKR